MNKSGYGLLKYNTDQKEKMSWLSVQILQASKPPVFTSHFPIHLHATVTQNLPTELEFLNILGGLGTG
jgi:hypothetical protein